MTAPPDVLAAAAEVSFTIPCVDGCWETVEVYYSLAEDKIRHRHRNRACEIVILPDGAAARSLGWLIMEEIERRILSRFADYGDDPVSEYAEVA